MKKLFLILAFTLIGTFAFANTIENFDFQKGFELNQTENTTTLSKEDGSNDSVTYCVLGSNGDLFCCEADSFGDARDCARAMVKNQ